MLRLACVCFVVASLSHAQSVPPYISYQGRLGAPMAAFTGPTEMRASVYTNQTQGDAIWGPQVFDGQSSSVTGHAARVQVVDGYFGLILGQYDTNAVPIADAFAEESTWVEVVAPGVTNARQRLLSVPYAMRAGVGGRNKLLSFVTGTNDSDRQRFVCIRTPDPTNVPYALRHYVLEGYAGARKEVIHSEIAFDTSDLFAIDAVDLAGNYHYPVAYAERATGRVHLQLYLQDTSELSLALYGLPTARPGPVSGEYVCWVTNAHGGDYGLVAYYPMDGNAYDCSRFGQDGTWVGTEDYDTDAVFGEAARFDGSSYVRVSNPEQLGFSGSFSVSMWAKAEDLPGDSRRRNHFRLSVGGDGDLQYAMSNANSASGFDVRCGDPNQTVRLGVTASSRTVVGRWHHYVGVVDGNRLLLYMDGAHQDTASPLAPFNFRQQSLVLTIGGGVEWNAWDWKAKGLIDDVRVYGRALSGDDIRGLYRQGQ
jgi:hypothetical protein